MAALKPAASQPPADQTVSSLYPFGYEDVIKMATTAVTEMDSQSKAERQKFDKMSHDPSVLTTTKITAACGFVAAQHAHVVALQTLVTAQSGRIEELNGNCSLKDRQLADAGGTIGNLLALLQAKEQERHRIALQVAHAGNALLSVHTHFATVQQMLGIQLVNVQVAPAHPQPSAALPQPVSSPAALQPSSQPTVTTTATQSTPEKTKAAT